MRSASKRVTGTGAALTGSWANKHLRICFLALFCFSFAARSGSLEIPYISKVLDWPISLSGYIIAICGMVTLAMLVSLVSLTHLASR